MLYCLVAFILGWLVSRQMGNGFRVSASSTEMTQEKVDKCNADHNECKITCDTIWNACLDPGSGVAPPSNSPPVDNINVFGIDFPYPHVVPTPPKTHFPSFARRTIPLNN